MGKRAKLYGRAYAESLGCLKSDTTEEVEYENLISEKKLQFTSLFQIKEKKMNAKEKLFQSISDPEEASSFAGGKASVKLQCCRQLGRYGHFLFFAEIQTKF